MPSTPWMARDAWAALAAKGEAPDASLRKAYLAEISTKDDDKPQSRTLSFTVSTGVVDRDRDTINPEGWKLTNFKKNPAVLWAHDYRQPPIARAKRIRIEDGALKADAEFAPTEVYPFAETIFQLLKGGFLKATSVGFRPLKHAFNAERGGMDFEAQELLEFSIVPVPANPEALLDAKAAGIDLEPIQKWASDVLLATAAEGKPFPNEHACRLRDPDDFEADSFRRVSREHEGKRYAVIMGRLDGEDTLTEQAYRYPKDTWSVAQARGHCRDHEGRFEPASGEDAVKDDHGDDDCPRDDCPMRGKAVIRQVMSRLDAIETRLAETRTAAEPEIEDAILLIEDDPEPEGLALDAEELQAALTGAFTHVVQTEVRSAVNALTGRVD